MSATIHQLRPLAKQAPESCPIEAGERVHVPEPVPMPCGRKIRRGHYSVLRSEWCDARGSWRLVVEIRPDCSDLPPRFRPDPKTGYVPLCAEPTRVYLDAGQYTHYASGEPEVIDDRHTQTV
ncbi:MAG: hypothetical protein AAFQ43_00495 [Bacteroidota bacterium]